MAPKFTHLAAFALAFCLSGCAATTRFDAAGDLHAFLVSIRDSDQAAFDAHVDRPALETQLRARLMAEAAKRSGGGTLGALAIAMGRPVMDAVADRLIQPDVFRAVADDLGYSAAMPIPGRLVIAEALRPASAWRGTRGLACWSSATKMTSGG